MPNVQNTQEWLSRQKESRNQLNNIVWYCSHWRTDLIFWKISIYLSFSTSDIVCVIRTREENVVLEEVTASPVPPRPSMNMRHAFNLDTLFEKAISFSNTKEEFTPSRKIVGYIQIIPHNFSLRLDVLNHDIFCRIYNTLKLVRLFVTQHYFYWNMHLFVSMACGNSMKFAHMYHPLKNIQFLFISQTIY